MRFPKLFFQCFWRPEYTSQTENLGNLVKKIQNTQGQKQLALAVKTSYFFKES